LVENEIGDPHLAVHGSFSVMVNYHAIGLYATSKGGFALHNPQEEASLKVSVFMIPSNSKLMDYSLVQETIFKISFLYFYISISLSQD